MTIKDLMGKVFSSKTKKADDGRDQWPSRASFILAAMGGCVGLGNILRYVSGLHSNLSQHPQF
jgi:solute carrier family 6 GABA transporter-like protein 1